MRAAGEFEPLHPEGRPLSDFERSLWRLKMVSHEVNLLICSVTRSDERTRDQSLLFSLTNYGLILVTKFLEIWEQFNAMAADNRRVREITQTLSPAVRRITKTWPKIKSYRNWAIAHPYSIRDEPHITPPWKLLEAEVGPFQHAEIMVLLDCVRFATAGTLAYYGDIYRKLSSTFDAGEEPETTRGVLDGAEAEAERRRLAAEIDERLEKVGVNMRDTVFKEYRCPPLEEPQHGGTTVGIIDS